MKVAVTGGAGYIGSHAVKLLGERGHGVLTIDNLSTGSRASVLYGELLVADVSDIAAVGAALRRFQPDAVMHFAASTLVHESVGDPLGYYRNNTCSTVALLEAMRQAGVGLFIYSSTASVYGVPERSPISEDAPLAPISPYGRSKMVDELVLGDLARAERCFRYVSLRYFNVAGADREGRLGQTIKDDPHLMTRVLKAAKGESERLEVYGTDYPTPDGTCIRDYIHVDDVAEAHVKALEHLAGGGESGVFNLGYGHGHSVREVVEAAKRVTGVDFRVVDAPRREGDPPALVADSSKIRRVLGWKPRHDDLSYIIRTAWDWERRL